MNPLIIYNKLLSAYGKQEWWPISHLKGKEKEWEICLGAILTQNTNWKNVEKALANMKKEDCLNPEKIIQTTTSRLEKIIRPSGFYKQKTKRLKALSRFALSFRSVSHFREGVTREQLLGVNGVGEETADSILLYACNRPEFVVDAYTKRIFSRIGLLKEEKYGAVKEFFESQLERNTELYKQMHALIVTHAKTYCKKEPLCRECSLNKVCKTGIVDTKSARKSKDK